MNMCETKIIYETSQGKEKPQGVTKKMLHSVYLPT